MKKLIAVFLTISLLFSICFANGSEAITWHSIFGLSEGATEEEISKTIRKTFSVEPSPSDNHYFYPVQKYFFTLPVQWVIIEYTNVSGYQNSGLRIEFEDDCLSAKNVEMLYNSLYNEFGDPTLVSITKEIITINGNENAEIEKDDLESIQQAIDQNNISGIIFWDNIWIYFSSFVYDSRAYYSLEIHAAFSKASLDPRIRKIYGIKLE